MKFLCVALFLVTFVVGAYSMSATFGIIPLITRETIVRFPVNGQIITELYRFPKKGQIYNRRISAVRVVDNFKNNTGANPSFTGGPGESFAIVGLKSQLSSGINSTIEIWG